MSGARERIDHGRNAWRDRGKPRKYRVDQVCKDKRRFVDEIAARALGQVSLIERANADRIWPYRCRHCSGWHLTHHPQRGVLPITAADALEGAPRRRMR